VIGVFFGLFELRQALRNRRDVTAMQIIGTEANPDPGKAAGAYVSFKGVDHR